MAAPRARIPARYGAWRVPAPPPGMMVELLTPEPPPVDPELAPVPEPVPADPVLESVPVLPVVSVPEPEPEPLPELVSDPVPTFVWPPVFPLGATETGAAAEPAI